MASIRKRGNSYEITISAGYTAQGKKILKTKTVKLNGELSSKQTEKELQRMASEFERTVQNGTHLDGGNITLEEFSQKWLADYAEKQLAPKTVARYREILKTRILPAMGHLKLSKIQPTHLMNFYSNLEEKGIRLDTTYKPTKECNKIKSLANLSKSSGISQRTLASIKCCKNNVSASTAEKVAKALNVKITELFEPNTNKQLAPQTIRHHHRLLSAMLNDAVEWQLIMSNPVERVKPPKVTNHQVSFYDEEQIKTLVLALDAEPIKYKAMVIMLIFTGLRVGELFGLCWDDINKEKSTLNIDKTLQYLRGKGIFEKDTKNASSNRLISVPEAVIDLLFEYKTQQKKERLSCGDLWQGTKRIFTAWNGKDLSPYTLTNWFPDFLKRHNLPKITPHGLRHSQASLLIALGLEVTAVSKRLGHSRATTTMSIYAHALQSADKVASDKLDELFFKNGTLHSKQA